MLAHPTLQLAAVLSFIAPTLCAAADVPRVAPESPAWTAGSGFSFPQAKKPEKVRQSLSGIACPPPVGVARRCVAAFDEGVEARYVVIDGQTLRPEPEKIVLLPSGKELDAEGAARDGDVIYITGSHAPKRGDCSANPDSRHVLRLTVDPSAGRSIAGKASDDKGNLWKLMGGHSVLGEFVGENTCLGASNHNLADHKAHAIDIEGLAAKGGNLYFGFRGPAKEGTLGTCDKELKPEAIALLEDGSDFRRLLVLSDGMCDGGPISFRIPK
jgi:hypothetical protein